MGRWAPAAERFWGRVDRTGDCWVWTGNVSSTGYGWFHDGAPVMTHRYAYAATIGPIPTGVLVCHRCDNRRCVRPEHLFLGTNRDNTIDMVTKGRQRAPRLAGESHGEAKLTDAAVQDILTSPLTGRELADRYGVTPSAISLVRRRKSWRHIAARRLSQGVLDLSGGAA